MIYKIKNQNSLYLIDFDMLVTARYENNLAKLYFMEKIYVEYEMSEKDFLNMFVSWNKNKIENKNVPFQIAEM